MSEILCVGAAVAPHSCYMFVDVSPATRTSRRQRRRAAFSERGRSDADHTPTMPCSHASHTSQTHFQSLEEKKATHFTTPELIKSLRRRCKFFFLTRTKGEVFYYFFYFQTLVFFIPNVPMCFVFFPETLCSRRTLPTTRQPHFNISRSPV